MVSGCARREGRRGAVSASFFGEARRSFLLRAGGGVGGDRRRPLRREHPGEVEPGPRGLTSEAVKLAELALQVAQVRRCVQGRPVTSSDGPVVVLPPGRSAYGIAHARVRQ